MPDTVVITENAAVNKTAKVPALKMTFSQGKRTIDKQTEQSHWVEINVLENYEVSKGRKWCK